jgi:hypothetical protein
MLGNQNKKIYDCALWTDRLIISWLQPTPRSAEILATMTYAHLVPRVTFFIGTAFVNVRKLRWIHFYSVHQK